MKMSSGAQRVVLVCFDVCCCLFIAAAVLLVCAPPAFAYVDPSVMTYTIQALAGVAVALSAVLGVAFRRVRKKLVHVFNIDENANKLVEHDIHPVETVAEGGAFVVTTADEAIVGAEGLKAEKAAAKERFRISWPKRLVLSLLVAVFLVFTAYVAPSYELVAGGESSLIFGLVDVWRPVAIAACISAVLLGLVLSLFRGRVFNILLAVVVALGVCSYVQAMFLNIGLPAANGAGVTWTDYAKITLCSSVIWIVFIVAAIALAVKKVSLMRAGTAILCTALLIVQGVGTASLWAAPAQAATELPNIVTEQGLFSVSEKSNVVVFVLDTLDTSMVKDAAASDPHFFDDLTGFTFYENSAGGMIPTRWGIPFLLGGVEPQKSETVGDWYGRRYTGSNYIPDIHEAGYSMGIYSDSVGEGVNVYGSETINIHPLAQKALSDEGTVLTLAKTSFYRDLPWIAKPAFWYTTDDVNSAMVLQKSDEKGGDIPYVIDDATYYDRLASRGLSTTDEGPSGAFRFIHLEGSHEPYTMDENAHDVGVDASGIGNSTLERQTRGSFVIVEEYLDQLKALGLYDKTTVIITADHGYWTINVDELPRTSCPAILVKPAGQGAQSEEPIRYSDVPVDHSDVLATVIDAVGRDNASDYGIPVQDVPMTDRRRYFYFLIHDGHTDFDFKLYEIDGDANDFENWRLTGDDWVITPTDDSQ